MQCYRVLIILFDQITGSGAMHAQFVGSHQHDALEFMTKCLSTLTDESPSLPEPQQFGCTPATTEHAESRDRNEKTAAEDTLSQQANVVDTPSGEFAGDCTTVSGNTEPAGADVGSTSITAADADAATTATTAEGNTTATATVATGDTATTAEENTGTTDTAASSAAAAVAATGEEKASPIELQDQAEPHSNYDAVKKQAVDALSSAKSAQEHWNIHTKYIDLGSTIGDLFTSANVTTRTCDECGYSKASYDVQVSVRTSTHVLSSALSKDDTLCGRLCETDTLISRTPT